MYTIDEHRKNIDMIDDELLTLLNRRAQHSLEIRKLKPKNQKSVFDPKREEDIIKRLQESSNGPLYRDGIREIYSSILKVMKETPL